MGEGWRGVDLAAGRCNAHAAEERVQRDVDAWREVREHGFAVERDDAGAAVGELHGQEATAQAETVAGEVGVELHGEDLHFEGVAGFGFVYSDRAGEDVATRAAVLDLVIDGRGVRGNLVGFDALRDHAFR